MKQFLTSDSRGKAIYVSDTVFSRLTPEIRYRALNVEVNKHGDVYVVCEPFRKISLMDCTVVRSKMLFQSFQDMTPTRQRKK